MTNILFLGNNTAYSNRVKRALAGAGYTLSAYGRKPKWDVIVSAAYGKKIANEELRAAKYGGLNLHPSLLPAYRGATPVPRQILDGVTESGVTIIEMADKIDAGPIIAQEKVAVKPDDTGPDLLDRCFATGAKLLIKILPDYLAGKIKLTPQPDQSPTPYCKRFSKDDGYIVWGEVKKSLNLTFESLNFELARKVRALFPWPGAWTTMPNGKILKLLPKNMLQLEGKQPITLKQFLAGYGKLLFK